MRVNIRRSIAIVGGISLFLCSGNFANSQGTVVNKEENFIYDDHGKRDPLWTLLGHRGMIMNYDNDLQASDMSLEGVLVEPSGDSVAIINGNIVKVGDKVGFYVVKSIQVNVVILQKGQEIITLKLKKEE